MKLNINKYSLPISFLLVISLGACTKVLPPGGSFHFSHVRSLFDRFNPTHFRFRYARRPANEVVHSCCLCLNNITSDVMRVTPYIGHGACEKKAPGSNVECSLIQVTGGDCQWETLSKQRDQWKCTPTALKYLSEGEWTDLRAPQNWVSFCEANSIALGEKSFASDEKPNELESGDWCNCTSSRDNEGQCVLSSGVGERIAVGQKMSTQRCTRGLCGHLFSSYRNRCPVLYAE